MKKLALPLAIVFALLAATVALAAGLLNLPAGPVTVDHGPWNQGVLGGTIDITLSGIPGGYDVANGTYLGWCAEDNFQDDFDGVVTLYDSTGSLPAGLAGPWDKINYLLNHKNGSKEEIQAAIWLLTGGNSYTFPVTPAVTAMFDDADAKAQAIALIGMPDGDKSYTLFRAYVSAYLNGLIGNDTSCVASTMTAAYNWLNTYEPGSKVKASSAAWKIGEPLYLKLDAYNNGLLCAPHRK